MRSATQREYTTPTLKPGTRYEVEIWTVTSIGKGNVIITTGITYQSKPYNNIIVIKFNVLFISMIFKLLIHALIIIINVL